MSDSAATQKLDETKQQATEPQAQQKTDQKPDEKEQAEHDKKLAIRMADCIQQSLDKIQPILKMITEVRTNIQLD
ncbi:predicted protein [Uncinocarpus reesii 1704]|uniref:DUF6987 domain-containing protein n=1 Tax=Uncinocarpus reesii (strain UAMH 1704) TaxID=336963 RepID=C4JWZ7_UNCRE|nr:uncharacterized protein UREG_06170 [Uncinocarpus reesii 1704]EEP81305.1 predicted protein [Uncinocarpus reesii 1704]